MLLDREKTMSRLIKRIGIWLVWAACSPAATTLAQEAGTSPSSPPARRPFAKPETPRRTERIRFVDIKHIKAELSVDARKREIRGVVTHTLSPLHPYFTQLELDCGEKLKVSKVTVGAQGAVCEFKTKGSTLSISLDKAYGVDDTIDVAIAYSGSPDRGLFFVLPETPYPEKHLSFWTQGESEDTRHWLPCYDYPNERATSEMIVTTEKPLFVLSNGALVETRENTGGTTTYHWKMSAPHSSYLISLAASDFAVYHDRLGDLPVDYYVAHSVDQKTARRFMGKTPKMVQFFAEKTGQPYPYAKYAQVCVPDFIAGGMENITATTMTDTALHDEIAELEGDQDGLVAHELAHQWFGDLLTCKDWSHVWLNEGFASYFDALFTEFDRGDDAFRIGMNGSLAAYIGSDLGYRRPIVEARYDSADDMFDTVTYSKGACVLHTLRGVVGDAAWWKGIREYVALHKNKTVESDDFRKAVEAASGQDLKWFFDQWVYKSGHPELKVRWHYEDADKTVRVQIEQTQKLDDQTPLFRLPTTLEITGPAGHARVVPIVITNARQEFIIAAPERPKMVLIDPQGWLTKQLDFEKPVDENLFQLEHAGSILDRLDAARALARSAKDQAHVAQALSSAWEREKSVIAAREMLLILCNGDETFRAALIKAAGSPEARVRVAAVGGLAALKRDSASEPILRASWTNPKEAYGARRAALKALVAWKVSDADQLLADALKLSVDRHGIAASALELMLETPGAKSRELAALYSRYGQPEPLRSAAIGAFSRLAKDDPALQDVLIELADDRDRYVRLRAWTALRDLGVKKAIPILEAWLTRESIGLSGYTRHVLEDAIHDLKEQGREPKGTSPLELDQAQGLADLERQATELELKTKELRNRITTIKAKSAQKSQRTGAAPAASTSGTEH
jgi:aminopeptidase N